ncbi:ATP-binding protein [Actinophytocola sp.]|uniref:ATP-binding protein n=1 Tax=Actinophytocola sp. TaxID=1872138 RepID=UPI003D6A15F6
MSVGDGDARPDEIELRLRAELSNLPIIRSLTSSIAMRADFDLDAIADLKLAVDEACSTLITRAAPDASLCCTFSVTKDEIRFLVSVHSVDESTPSSDTFGWRVLTTLTDHTGCWVERDDGQHLVHIEVAKHRADGPV